MWEIVLRKEEKKKMRPERRGRRDYGGDSKPKQRSAVATP